MNRQPTLWFASIVVALASPAWAATPIPAPPQDRPIALTGATIHPVSGPPIEGGTILFDKGKIIDVGPDANVPVHPHCHLINCKGKHIYPGLIDAHSQTGLVEIEAVRATNDLREVGLINPNVRAQIAVNPDSEVIPVTRAGGVLATLTCPMGAGITGTSALMQLDGWTWEEMTVRAPVAMHLNWPSVRILKTRGNEDVDELWPEKRDEATRLMRQAFADARAYAKAKTAAKDAGQPAPAFDARWEAMLPVFEKKIPVMIQADDVEQIQSAVAFAAREDVKMILLGGYDAPLCAALLKRHNVPVVIAGVHRLPLRHDDPYDHPFTLAERLHKEGIKFAVSGEARAANVRNLPHHAAMAAAYGLSKEEAVKSITLYPAQILGAGGRLGSLEKGKDATLIVTDGDVLDIRMNVEQAFIQGRQLDLNHKQLELWRKYREKYRRQAAPPAVGPPAPLPRADGK